MGKLTATICLTIAVLLGSESNRRANKLFFKENFAKYQKLKTGQIN